MEETANMSELTFEQKMELAADLKAKVAELEPYKRQLDAVRAELDFDMQTLHSKRSEPVKGYYALVVETEALQITDERAVEAWLDDPDNEVFDPEVYYTRKLDARGLTALAKQTLETTGELIPGLQTVKTRRVDIRKAVK